MKRSPRFGCRFLLLSALVSYPTLSTVYAQTNPPVVDSKAIVNSEFLNENAPYPSCHASTIAQLGPNNFVAAWFGGTRERNPDVGIWFARQENGNWLPAVEVANGIHKEGPRLPTWNPVLFQPKQGPLVLFYKVGPAPRDWWGMMKTSTDGGQTRSEAKRLQDKMYGPVKNKPVEMQDGSWLCPSSVEGNGWNVQMELTRDAGKTWTKIGPVEQNGFKAIQPSIVFLPDARLQALCRTANGVVAATYSSDNGKSWTPLKATTLPNPNSGTDAVTLADGRILMVYNNSAPPPERPTKGLRYPIDVANFKRRRKLEACPHPRFRAMQCWLRLSYGHSIDRRFGSYHLHVGS